MTDDELIAANGGDVCLLALRVNRLLVERAYPDAEYASLGIHLRDGVPDVMLPVTSRTSSSFPRPPAPART